MNSSKTNTTHGRSGRTSIPPIGTSLGYIETSSKYFEPGVFVSFERTDISQTSNIIFCCKRLSAKNNISTKHVEIKYCYRTSHRHSKCLIDKHTNYSSTSTVWCLINNDFTETNYGNKMVYDQVDTTLADMCFSKIMVTHSVFWESKNE